MAEDIYHGKTLATGLLPAATTLLYHCPMGKRAIVETITLVNTDASTRTVNLYVNSGGTGRRITPVDQSLTTGMILADDELHRLSDGDSIEGAASAASVVSYVISGQESE